MAQPESDDLSHLMPNLARAAGAEASPGDTMALRRYMQVLGDQLLNVPAASTLPHKPPRADGLPLRAGTGRRPQRRYFTIKWREEEPVATADEEAAAAELDPEALKDALVEQARAQRRALLQAALRPGTGRQPRSRKISITLPPLQLEEDEPAEEEVQHGEAAPGDEAALTEEELAALADAELAVQQLHDSEAAWECMAAEEEGMLAQAAAGAAPQPADAATPGAALWQQEQQAEYGGAAGDEMQPGTSQHGQARTPATSLLGRYTPMEGVPERLALLATRGKGGASLGGAALPATGSRSVRPAGTPAGFTPLEGIPERLHAFQPLPGATRVLSNLGVPSVDSPVEGLVHEAARRRSIGAAQQPADVPVAAAAEGEGEVAAGGSFGGFARLAEQAEAAAAEAGTAAGAAAAAAAAALPVDDDDDDDDVGGGFADDGGFDDEEPPTASAGGDSPRMADAAMQTGISLGADEAAAPGGSPDAAVPFDDGYDGAFEADGGNAGHYDGFQQQAGLDDADLPGPSAPQRKPRRPTQDPGARLRKEINKRKSLVADPRIGRQELLPGMRRTTRQREAPLKWWLNEKKEFGRQHKTMPTVANVVHKQPNTPWQMVSDYKRRPAKRQRAPTPHDLEDVLAATAAGEEEEEEAEQQEQQQASDDEEAAEQQQEVDEEQQAAGESEGEEQQQRQRRRRAAPQQPAAATRRSARGAAAEAPPVRGKAAQKAKAAGGGSKKRKGRR